MAKTTVRKINSHAWINDTWLMPYAGYIIKLIEYKNGRIDLCLDGRLMKHVEGKYCSEHNGWLYTVKKLLSQPLRGKQFAANVA